MALGFHVNAINVTQSHVIVDKRMRQSLKTVPPPDVQAAPALMRTYASSRPLLEGGSLLERLGEMPQDAGNGWFGWEFRSPHQPVAGATEVGELSCYLKSTLG